MTDSEFERTQPWLGMSTETKLAVVRELESSGFVEAREVGRGGFGIVFQAAILAAVARLGLGETFLGLGSVINGGGTLWLALWTFARSWHVERRLKAGLEVDEPKLSIMANFRGS